MKPDGKRSEKFWAHLLPDFIKEKNGILLYRTTANFPGFKRREPEGKSNSIK